MDTSPFAYEHALRNVRKSRTTSKAVAGAVADTHTQSSGFVIGALVWLYHMFIKFAVGDGAVASLPTRLTPDYKDPAFVAKYGRVTRKLIETNRFFVDMAKMRRLFYIDCVIYGGLTPTQEQEKRARISLYGRIVVYGLRFWRTGRIRGYFLSCLGVFDWDVARPPVLMGGLSGGQLPPDKCAAF